MGTAFGRFFRRTLSLSPYFLLLLLGLMTSSADADTLSPQKIQEITDKAVKSADAQKRMEDIDKELRTNTNLTEAQRKQLQDERADMDRSRQANENTVRTLEGPEGNQVFDKAKDARLKEYELRQAEEDAARATGEDKKKAERRVTRLRLELQDLKRPLGTGTTFPPLPAPGRSLSARTTLYDTVEAPTSPAQSEASSGAANTGAKPMVNVSLHGTYHTAKKGGTKEIATADIKKTARTHVTATLTGREENPEKWKLTGGLAYGWGMADALAPMMTYAKDGDYSIGYAIPRSELTTMQEKFSSLKIHANYGQTMESGVTGYGEAAHTIPQLPFSIPTFSEAADSFYDVPTGDISIDDRLSYVGRMMPNVNLTALNKEFQAGGLPDVNTWNAWTNPLGTPMFQYYLDGPNALERFKETVGLRLDYVEANEDRHIAVPNWNPVRWPSWKAEPVPRVHIRRTGSREQP